MKSNSIGGVHRPQRTRSKILHHHSSHGVCNQLEQQLQVAADTVLCPPTIPISRLALQCMFCFISLILGFRFTREATLFAANLQHGTTYALSSFNFSADSRSSGIRSNLMAWHISQTLGNGSNLFGTLSVHGSQQHPAADPTILAPSKLSQGKKRASVWRHEILVRPWPHPDPLDIMRAYGLISRIQLEQRQFLHGIKDWNPVIAITPTSVRTCQALHLTALSHTLSLVPGPVIWIVIEAGGVTNETASLLTQVRVHRLVHLGLGKSTTPGSEAQELLETRLRIKGLRFVWEQKLEGVVVFADESNVHNLQFFDKVQEVDWVGVASVGMLGHARFGDQPREGSTSPGGLLPKRSKSKEQQQGSSRRISDAGLRFEEPRVQGPVCDATGNHLVGLHTFGNVITVDHRALLFTEAVKKPHKKTLEWAGFVLNARAVWEAGNGDQPAWWLKAWLDWTISDDDSKVPDIRAVLSDERRVKVLGGGCGRRVLLWWARMEAHANSNSISKWTLDSPLEIVIPASSMPSWRAMRSRERSSSPPPVPNPSPGGADVGAYQQQ